jgi:hemerythrin-like metal-binding protein
MTWNDSYSVKVTCCDEEHKKLISLINSLHQAMSAGKGRSVIGPVIQELHNYVGSHFRNEEALMEKTGYPALAAHRGEHQKFVAQAVKFSDELEEGLAVPMEVIMFLRDWLVNHIQHTDRAYGPHLNARGIK